MTSDSDAKSVASNLAKGRVTYVTDWTRIMKRGIPMLALPIILLVLILISKNFYFLEYFHAV